MRLRHVKNATEIINNGKYYIEDPFVNIGKWSKEFDNDNPIYIEIGMGKGNFIIENAIRYLDINFIGIERYDSVMVRAIEKSNDLELNNLRLVKIDAIDIDKIFNNEIDLIYLNFSDPWPKDRHAKRRLTSPIFLKLYDNIFKNSKHIIMKTDNNNLFEYSIDSLSEYGYEVKNITRDLISLNDKDNIMTEYESKFVDKGIKINRLEASKN